MKTIVLLVTSACLLLASGISAQRFANLPRHIGEPQAPPGSACSAGSVRCLFGTAGGCSAYCQEPGLPVCESASCPLGFPAPARCFCTTAAG
jgi:hypothetical protein